MGRMIVGDNTDPRAPQAAFLVPTVALVALVMLFTPTQVLGPTFLAGLLLVGVATLVAVAAPWERLPAAAMMAVPLLDLAAIGSLRLNQQVGVVAALVVFPAMWLGTVFRWRGVVIATVASVLALTVPGLVYFGGSLEGWTRAVLLPTIAFVTAKSMSVIAEVWAEQRTKLEQQGIELARALEQVTEQRRLGDAIFETVDVGLLALGRDGSYSSMNPRQRDFLRLSYPEGHRGRAGQLGYVYAADKVTPLTKEQMPSIRAARGETFSNYMVWAGKDLANRRAVSVSARPMYDENGEFDGAVLAYKDITEVMQALRVKDEFVASVSHELRTPLTSILGYLDLVRDHEDELPDEVTGFLRVTRRNAERLLLLVSDLLTTAQTVEGTMRLSPSPTDLAQAIRLSVAAAAPRIQAAGLEVSLDLEPLPLVLADRERFTQVVDNLLSNAVKYTERGGAVRLSLRRERDAVLFTVADNGIGISESDQQSLFTKFFRARTAEERAIPGVGLGLVIIKAIVASHGGTIDVASREGEGTTVRVRLPLAVASTTGTDAVQPTRPSPLSGQPNDRPPGQPTPTDSTSSTRSHSSRG